MADSEEIRALPEEDAAAALGPGAPHYMAYVGPPDQYDLMGATQFMLLVQLGLRASHRLLDFGCGSLRAGRLLIPYLGRGNYHGLEPNGWLIEDAIRRQLGADLIALKWPHFFTFDDFRAERCGGNFDFIVAQSIFSHTGADLIAIALDGFARALAPSGLVLMTALHAGQDGTTAFHGRGWVYPASVGFEPEVLARLIAGAGFAFRVLPWFHPRQTWYALARNPARLPPPEHDSLLRGAILNVPAWKDSLTR